MPNFVRPSNVHSGRALRTIDATDAPPLRSSVTNSSIRTVSSGQWCRTGAEPIFRWSAPWRRSGPRNREPMAKERPPSAWTATTVATTVSYASFPYELWEKKCGNDINKFRKFEFWIFVLWKKVINQKQRKNRSYLLPLIVAYLRWHLWAL